ncbi:MAG: hypothetical protein ACNS62_01165 [Candidatus Cyclobacteriaceae bacterium M3_2C_046]
MLVILGVFTGILIVIILPGRMTYKKSAAGKPEIQSPKQNIKQLDQKKYQLIKNIDQRLIEINKKIKLYDSAGSFQKLVSYSLTNQVDLLKTGKSKLLKHKGDLVKADPKSLNLIKHQTDSIFTAIDPIIQKSI